MLTPIAYAAYISQSLPRILPILRMAAPDYVLSLTSLTHPDLLDLELDDPVDHAMFLEIAPTIDRLRCPTPSLLILDYAECKDQRLPKPGNLTRGETCKTHLSFPGLLLQRPLLTSLLLLREFMATKASNAPKRVDFFGVAALNAIHSHPEAVVARRQAERRKARRGGLLATRICRVLQLSEYGIHFESHLLCASHAYNPCDGCKLRYVKHFRTDQLVRSTSFELVQDCFSAPSALHSTTSLSSRSRLASTQPFSGKVTPVLCKCGEWKFLVFSCVLSITRAPDAQTVGVVQAAFLCISYG
eukprot:g68590.t1